MEGDTLTLCYKLGGSAPAAASDVKSVTVPRHAATEGWVEVKGEDDASTGIYYDVKLNTKTNDETYIFLKIPARATEDGTTVLTKDAAVYTAVEIKDTRASDAPENVYTASNAADYADYRKNVLGVIVTVASGISKPLTHAANAIPYREKLSESTLTDADGDGIYTANTVFFDGVFVDGADKGKEVPYHNRDEDTDDYVLTEYRTLDNIRYPIYTLKHTAPENADGYYIGSSTWNVWRRPSSFGDGYYDQGLNGDIKIYNDSRILSDANAAEALTVELALSYPKSGSGYAAFYIGPSMSLYPYNDYVKLTGATSAIEMSLKGAEINTYSFTYDLSTLPAVKGNSGYYTLSAYGNGIPAKTAPSQQIASTAVSFSAGNQYILMTDGKELHNHAVRVYAKTLSASEVLQNHFADVVTINALDLDIDAFLALENADKQKVYKCFEGVSASTDKAALQETLDSAIYSLLSAEDAPENALQNNFANIITENKLDINISAFLKLGDSEKLAAYEAFEDYTVDTDKATLQTELDIVSGAAYVMFEDCAALESITVLSESIPALPYKAFYGVPLEMIIVPAALLDDYKTAENWSDYADIICDLEENCRHSAKETLNEKKPTCGDEGYTGDIYCAICHDKLEDGSIMQPTGEHIFDKETVSDEYLKSGASCTSSAIYYKSCKCGASSKGSETEETFNYNGKLPHTYDVELPEAKFLKSEASCTEKAVYYKSCVCGESSKDTEFEATFEYGEPKAHTFDKQVTTYVYRKSFATADSAALYYYSCSCGAIGDEVFELGDKLPSADAVAILLTSAQAKAGETFTVDIKLQNNPGVSFISVLLDYDKKVFTLEKIENLSASDIDEGLNIQWSSDTDNSADGVWATLTFRVNEDAEAADHILTLTVNEAYDKDLDDVVFEVSDGIMSVDDGQIDEAVKQALIFEGYQAKTSAYPGLRSTYSITKSAIKTLEAYGKKVVVGAMMALATDTRAMHEHLTVPMADGAYDRTEYGDGYSYISGGVAYQEAYNSDAKSEECNGIVSNLTEETDEAYSFAFTTVYNGDSKTKENFTKGLLYRGFVVITDKDGTQTVFYANMYSEKFDENQNGDAITIYELSEYINNNLGDFNLTEDNDEIIDFVIDTVNSTELE